MGSKRARVKSMTHLLRSRQCIARIASGHYRLHIFSTYHEDQLTQVMRLRGHTDTAESKQMEYRRSRQPAMPQSTKEPTTCAILSRTCNAVRKTTMVANLYTIISRDY
jgi:hypothetical protein